MKIELELTKEEAAGFWRFAVFNRDMARMETLLTAGVDVGTIIEEGNWQGTALHVAAVRWDTAIEEAYRALADTSYAFKSRSLSR